MRIPYLILLLLLFLAACNNGQQQYPELAMNEAPADKRENMTSPQMASEKMNAPMAGAEEQPGNAPSTPITEPKIIKNANVRIKVKSLQESVIKLQALVKKHGGYITSSTETKTESEITSSLVIRVEHTKFESFLNEMQSAATQVDYKHIYTQDVTEEYIDVEARLSNRKRLEQRLLELLAQARTVEEIIKVEAQLATVREQIESHEGRLKYLNNKILQSTINLELYESIPLSTTPVVFFSDFVNAFSSGWKIFLSFIVTMAAAWPFLLVLAAILWWIRYRRRNKTRPAVK